MAEIYRLKTVANDRHHGRRSTTLLIDFIRWWAREDSNLQPSGYERAHSTGKFNKNGLFCLRTVTQVRG